MRSDERQSLARVKRAARVAQRAVNVLGSMAAADHWLTAPCAALRGKAPRDIFLDEAGARRVAIVLRRRASRQRAVRSTWLRAFGDEAALTAWLWKKNRALGNRRPAMLLDTERGAREVVQALPTGRARERRGS